jgi:hypothetical protein
LLAVLALGALSACSSQPGNRRVVSDVIESLEAGGYLDTAEEACMLDKLDGYTDDELDDIASDNENWDPAGLAWTQQEAYEQASEGLRRFIADYAECTGEEWPATASAEPTGSSEPNGSTATSGPAQSTEPAQTTEPVPTTG